MIGIVLAGGRSSRFGKPKWKAKYHAMTFEDRARQILQSTTDTQWSVVPHGMATAHYQIEDDLQWQGMGPLAGIATVMSRQKSEWYAVCACDTPLLVPEVYERLVLERNRSIQPIIAKVGDRIHPLIGLYPRRILPMMEAALLRGDRAVMPLLEEAIFVTFEKSDWFVNVNTQQDYALFVEEEGTGWKS